MPSRKRPDLTFEPAALSARNHRVQRLARLARRSSVRRAEGAFVIEGPTLVGEALRAGVEIETLFVATGSEEPSIIGLCAEVADTGAEVWRVEPRALARAADVVTPQPVAAIARQRSTTLDAVLAADPLSVVVLAGVADPGNAGTLVRAGNASGAAAVVFGDASVDPYNPKCVRASAGALFRVAVLEGPTADVLERLGAAGHRRLGATAAGGRPYDEVDLSAPVSVVLGNEAHGLDAALARHIDQWVTIPMEGHSESLNVAIAGSILCFEILRQRRPAAAPSRPNGATRGR